MVHPGGIAELMEVPVSIVVNTYNRAKSIRLTLESFTQLDYPNFEVIVVNGPSQDETTTVLEGFAGRIKVGCCPATNLSESRNIGVAMAAGKIVAFIDDDAYPDPAWLDRLVEGYDSDEVAAVGGPVYDHTGAALQARYTYGTRLGDARVGFEDVNPTDFLNSPWTAEFVNTLGTNSSFRRDRLLEIGGFDEELEYYLDENSVCWRLVEHGYVVKALADGFVYHKFLPSDVRGANRAARNRFQVLKSKCYFALKHGLGVHSFYDLCQNLIEFVQKNRSDYRWCVDHGLLAEDDYKQFEADVHTAFDLALNRFRSAADRTRPPEWFALGQEPFLPFPTRRLREDKLHICLLSQGYPPGPVNGIARVIHTLATGLAAEGHLVRVLTRGEGHDRVDLEEGVWVHRVVPREHPAPPFAAPLNLWSYSATLLDELRRIAAHRAVDIVEAPNWDSEGLAVLHDGGFTLVVGLYTPLSTLRQVDPNMVADNPHIEVMLDLERQCYRRAHAFRAAEVEIVERIEADYGVELNRERVGFIPHGLPDFTEGVVPERREGVNVLFLGRLEKRKGIDTLLACVPELVTNFPRLVFTIVGDDTLVGDDGITFREAFERCGYGDFVSERVTFTGQVDDDRRQRLYTGCDIFVAPSRSESFGLILVEAMMFGKPVIAGDNAGMRGIVEHGKNGYLVPPGDEAALKRAIASLASDPDRRASFGTRSRELFEARFSARRMVTETNRFYDRLVHRKTTNQHVPEGGRSLAAEAQEVDIWSGELPWPLHALTFAPPYAPSFALAIRQDPSDYERWIVNAGALHDAAILTLRLLRDQGLLIDVGANIGVVSAPVAAAGHAVLAVEMVPQNALQFITTWRLNDFHNVLCVPCAASDHDGLLRFQGQGEGAYVSAAPDAHPTLALKIDTIFKLYGRHLIPSRSPIIVLKIDVEGHEALVLRGATSLLQDLRCLVIFESVEIEGTANANPKAAKRTLLENGYRLFLIRGNVLIPQDDKTIQYGHVVDYLAVPAETLSTLSDVLADWQVRDLSTSEKLVWVKEMCEWPFIYHRRHAIAVLRRFHEDGVATVEQLEPLVNRLAGDEDAAVASAARSLLARFEA